MHQKNLILQKIIQSCLVLHDDSPIIKKQEDNYTHYLFRSLERFLPSFGIYVEEQYRSGVSGKVAELLREKNTKKPEIKNLGELDLCFKFNSNIVSILEALILNNPINKTNLKTHVNKVFDYGITSEPFLIILVYHLGYEIEDFWKKYQNFILNSSFRYPLINYNFVDISKQFSQIPEIRVGKGIHLKGIHEIELYHIIIQLYPID
jgi:hypothetical protein